jgi:hypothetical protein
MRGGNYPFPLQRLGSPGWLRSSPFKDAAGASNALAAHVRWCPCPGAGGETAVWRGARVVADSVRAVNGDAAKSGPITVTTYNNRGGAKPRFPGWGTKTCAATARSGRKQEEFSDGVGWRLKLFSWDLVARADRRATWICTAFAST